MVLDGQPLEEPYIKEPPASYSRFGPLTVPQGRVWVQGDNRHVSMDSRAYQEGGVENTTLPTSDVVGVVDMG
ncbi:hypothetical protein Aph01nite_69610 [Acrocarpospora phusangensis]|uniref:Peptidase S26 domain-containing protein n=2 Tax=Acrocarpospora phusangensis TaxID=1070424 RepID=A0A919UNL8_9ACTN|nr:hypothetical protein Aph01nite_69610 [Acrocarpospora phusangensis]